MMHISGDLPTQAVLVMSSVLATALTILASVLELALHTLEFLRSNLARHSLGSSMANESRDAVRELGVLFHIQENLIESTVARHDCAGGDKGVLNLDEPSRANISARYSC
jgi:hypothetical protein